ncbi:MAG: c-type cytochrome, partial [Polyangiaceae bacterium]
PLRSSPFALPPSLLSRFEVGARVRPSPSAFLLRAVSAMSSLVVGCADPAAPAPSPHETVTTQSASATAPPSVVAPAPIDRGRCVGRELGGRGALRPLAPDDESSAISLARLDEGGSPRSLVFVADADAEAIHVVDADRLEELAVTATQGKPKHVRVLEDGRVAVTLADRAEVALFELRGEPARSLELLCRASVAAEPWAIAERDGELLVTSGFGGALSILETRNLNLLRSVQLPREPRAIVLDDERKTAFISHAVGGALTVLDLTQADAAPTAISIRAGRMQVGSEDQPRFANQAYALAKLPIQRLDGKPGFRLLVPHASVDSGAARIAITTGYGGSIRQSPVAPIVATVDPVTRVSLTKQVVNQQSGSHDCLLPRSAAVDGARLYVACMDIDAVVAFDAELVDPSSAPLERIHVPPAPSALAIAERTLFVWSDLARSLSRVELGGEPHTLTSMAVWERDDRVIDVAKLRGRYLFTTSRDVRLASFRACATCHPEGRDDGLTWSSPDGKRQTPMLASRLGGTAPYGWFGRHKTLRDHLRHTVERLGGKGFSESDKDLDALVQYIGTLELPRPPEAPQDAARGKELFVAESCDGCHVGGSTDTQRHDVGSGPRFDTPSLVGVARSAPYFHDGRYATLKELLADPASGMLDEPLNQDDQSALLQYLETL